MSCVNVLQPFIIFALLYTSMTKQYFWLNLPGFTHHPYVPFLWSASGMSRHSKLVFIEKDEVKVSADGIGVHDVLVEIGQDHVDLAMLS